MAIIVVARHNFLRGDDIVTFRRRHRVFVIITLRMIDNIEIGRYRAMASSTMLT